MNFVVTFAHDVSRICIASKTKISFAILSAVLVSLSTDSFIFLIILQRISRRGCAFKASIMPMSPMSCLVGETSFGSVSAEHLHVQSNCSPAAEFSQQSWRSQFCRQFVQICDVIQAFREDLYSFGNVLIFLKHRGYLDFPMTNSHDFEPSILLHT